MIISKIQKITLILSVLFLTQCYTDPFFEMTVNIIDQNSNPIPNTLVTVEVVDIENGSLVNGSLIYFESTTNSSGSSMFSFDNKAFITVRACSSTDGENLCKEGHVYLEENTNKYLTLMLHPDSCLYCF